MNRRFVNSRVADVFHKRFRNLFNTDVFGKITKNVNPLVQIKAVGMEAQLLRPSLKSGADRFFFQIETTRLHAVFDHEKPIITGVLVNEQLLRRLIEQSALHETR